MSVFLDEKWQTFLKVAQLGSFTRAATFFNTPQSNVSRQVALLERELGVRLFERTGRGVALSEAGRRLLPRLASLTRDADALADDIATQGRTPMGEVRVGLLPWSVSTLAKNLYGTARKQYPQVQLHFCEGPSAQLRELLNEGRIDMALLLNDGDESTVHGAVLVRLSLHLVSIIGSELTKHSTVPFADLAGAPLIVPSVPHPLRARLTALEKEHKITLNYAVEADSIRLQHAIAAAGGGYAISSGLIQSSEDDQLVQSRIVEPNLHRTIVLTVTARRPDTLATRAIERLIRKYAPGLLKKMVR